MNTKFNIKTLYGFARLFSVIFYISLKEIKVAIEGKIMEHLFQNVTCNKTGAISLITTFGRQDGDFTNFFAFILKG